MSDIITHKGKQYLKVGDKAVPIDHFDKDGKPVILELYSEETPNRKGGHDCTIHVPCLQIVSKSETV